MLKDMILGFMRHALTTAGGALVAKGLITASQENDAIGAVIVLVGLAWSLYEKKARPAPATV